MLPAPAKEVSDDLVIWDENWDTVMMFLRMGTQWQVTMAGYSGMKYEVLLCAGGLFDLYDVKDKRGMLQDLQIMETAALVEMHKEKKGNG